MKVLKFYEKEDSKYEKERRLFHFEDKIAVKVCKKIARHFKFVLGEIVFRGQGEHGFARWKDYRVTFSHAPSILLICHELAHIFEYQRHKNRRHDKRLAHIVDRFMRYSKKKQYFSKV